MPLQGAFSGRCVTSPRQWRKSPKAPKKEIKMLTKFSAALLATSLIAGAALAAQPAAPTGSNSGMPATQTQVPSKPAATTNKVGKTVKSSTKHATRHRSHARKHVARGK